MNPARFWKTKIPTNCVKTLERRKPFCEFCLVIENFLVLQNCSHLKFKRFWWSQVFLRRRYTGVYQDEKRLDTPKYLNLRRTGFICRQLKKMPYLIYGTAIQHYIIITQQKSKVLSRPFNQEKPLCQVQAYYTTLFKFYQY